LASGIHHVSCCSHDESVATFLTKVVGLAPYDRFTAPGSVMASMFGWPSSAPEISGQRYGAGPNGLVEVLSVPAEVRDAVAPGVSFVTFTVRDLEARLEECRRLGFEVGAVGRFDPTDQVGLAAAVVQVGGVKFELAQYQRR
jgi:hypothetical protein